MEKIIRVDLANNEISEESLDPGHKLFFYAGRALTSKIIYDEVPPDSDPLGPENKLIFSAGFLSGTPAPNSGRISIGAKSPLTGGIKESNTGGRAPSYFANHGIRALILESRSPDWVIIKIEDSHVELLDGSEYQGMNNYELNNVLREKFGKKIGIFSVGVAGERGYYNSTVQSTDMDGYPSRAAARGGLGAVMGSKRVKAVIVTPPKVNFQLSEENYTDFKAFKEWAKEWFMDLYNSKRALSKYGTAILVNTVNALHGLPTKNFRSGYFEEADKISGDALHEMIVKNGGKYGIPCSPGCAIQCSNLVLDENGRHMTSSLEYETIGLNGSNLLISDLKIIAEIDRLCDDLGMDTIEMGNTLAVLMEAGKLKWGDGKAVIDLIKGIYDNSDESRDLGLGAYRLGTKLGVKRIPCVKKQGMPSYEPRTFKGMGITYATSPMGADHTAGPAIAGRKAYANKDYGELHEPDHKIELSRELQTFVMIDDACGLCYFVGPSWEATNILVDLLNAKYGWGKTARDLVKMAEDWLAMEVEYNSKAGIPEVEGLPEFILNEKEESIGRVWDVKEDLSDFWAQ